MADKFNLEGFSVDTDGQCTADGGFVGDITGDVTGLIFTTGHTTYSADGAIALTDSVVKLDASGASTVMTVAGGTEGQEIKIVCISSSNLCTVGFTGFNPSFNLVTFDIGDAITIAFTDGDWVVFSNIGAVIS